MGWFGEAGSRRQAAAAAAIDADAPAPPTAVCRDCDVSAVLAIDGKLPNGWSEVPDLSTPTGKSARCSDCTASHRRATTRRRQAAKSKVEVLPPAAPVRTNAGIDSLRRLEPAGPVFCGARIEHWPAADKMIIRMHGGATARIGRDEPIHFLADADALDTIGAHFAELAAACRAAAAPAPQERAA